jgi:hypothetical protein
MPEHLELVRSSTAPAPTDDHAVFRIGHEPADARPPRRRWVLEALK